MLKWVMRAAVMVAAALLALKVAAYLLTRSSTVLGTALDGCLDMVTTGMNALALRWSLKPADKHHRFGHEKIESVAGLLQGLFLIASAIMLIVTLVMRLDADAEVTHTRVGMALMVVSLVVASLLVAFQSYVLRRTTSVVLHADRAHYAGDIGLYAAAIVALAVPALTWVDALLAGCVAMYLTWQGTSVARKSVAVLIDREATDSVRLRIEQAVHGEPRVVGLHDLRVRDLGRRFSVQFHLELPHELSLAEASTISRAVETRVVKALGRADVLIRVEPSRGESVTPVHSKP